MMKSQIIRAGLLIAGFFFQTSITNAQVGTLVDVPANQSPQAASLGKFVEIPVGLYNGIPDISVPLYKLSFHDLNIPISLSYNASGIKVGDIAGQVGTGFSLNAGGVITRIVRGSPDHFNWTGEEQYSYFDTAKYQKIYDARYVYSNIESTFNVEDCYRIVATTPGVSVEGFMGNPSYVFEPLDTELDVFISIFWGIPVHLHLPTEAKL